MEVNQNIEFVRVEEEASGVVVLTVEKPMDPVLFTSQLDASMSRLRQQGKTEIYLRLYAGHNLVESAVKAGFRYHHAARHYSMFVCRMIPDIPAYASHLVGVCAFVINDKNEVLVVQETDDIGIWKMPIGAVNEGENIFNAAIREVKEVTGIETKFVEVLAFRESLKSSFQKSDLFFVCMLQPQSFDIPSQASEIDAAKWMPVEDFAAQPFVQENELFDFIPKICLEKSDGSYLGFSKVLTSTSGRGTHLYFSNPNATHLLASNNTTGKRATCSGHENILQRLKPLKN